MRNFVTDKTAKKISSNAFSANVLRRLIFLCGFSCVLTTASAQYYPQTPITDLSKIQTAEKIKSITYAAIKKNSVNDSEIAHLDISKTIPASYEERIPIQEVGKNLYLKFSLCNTSDSPVQMYFFPGKYCRELELFRTEMADSNRHVTRVQGYSDGFMPITLAPKEKSIFFVRLGYILTTVNNLSPTMVTEDFLPHFKTSLRSDKTTINLLNYLTAGIMLMMIFYSIAVYFQSGTIEFIYYSGYATCMALLLFLKSYLFGSTTSFNYFFEGFFDFNIQMTGYYFFILFFRKFLNTKQDHPFLEKTFVVLGW